MEQRENLSRGDFLVMPGGQEAASAAARKRLRVIWACEPYLEVE
jgi:hypothetical protein